MKIPPKVKAIAEFFKSLDWTKDDLKFLILVVIAIILFRMFCVNPLIDKIDNLPAIDVNGSINANVSGNVDADVSGRLDADVSGSTIRTDVSGDIEVDNKGISGFKIYTQ